MKISYNWLKEYHDLELDPLTTSDILTQTGLEVEGLERTGDASSLEGVVVGEVVEKESHPDADRLSVTKVDVGNGEPLNIVCGAPNVEAGQKVLVATVGSVLQPNSGEAFKIKKAKIRGVESMGMICAEDELGLGESHDGIMVLEHNAKVGAKASEYLEIKEDHCIEIGLTPNRADAMSHIGTARDLVAAVNNNDEIDQNGRLIWPDLSAFTIDDNSLRIDVVVEDEKGCPRYAGLTMTGIKVEPSPQWLQDRLVSIGLSPINNIVDVTNFVQHEYGQPLHAFDAEKITDNRIVVRRADPDEKFVTLDEVERELSDADLMICNANESMCIAGVFGGKSSGVSDSTTSIFIESAWFDPVSIRKTARRHGLNTDASFRFERGVDPEITIDALKRAAILIREICGANVSSEIVDLYPEPLQGAQVQFSYDRCNDLTGVAIPEEKVRSILTSLDIEIHSEQDGKLQLRIPAYRNDVTREADVIEEVLRIYGYNNVPDPDHLRTSIAYSVGPDREALRNRTSDFLSANGFSEMMANSLTSASLLDLSDSLSKDKAVEILNPLSSELDTMRQTLLFGALSSIAHNVNRQLKDLKLYEFGKVYFKYNEYSEGWRLSIAQTGNTSIDTWNGEKRAVEIYDTKAIVEGLLADLGIKRLKVITSRNDLLNNGSDIKVGKRNIGSIGPISKKILKAFDIDQEVQYVELDWDAVIQLAASSEPEFESIPKYPSVRRDLSLLLEKEVQFAQIEKIAKQQEQQLLTQVGLFDVYEGKGLPSGKKSYAVSFVFQDPSATLTDKKVDAIVASILSALEQQLGAQLR